MCRTSLFVVFFLSLLSVPIADVPAAHAGVLLRSQRVTSRVNFRAPRVRLQRARPSTRVAKRLNPIGRGRVRGNFNGVSAVLAYRKRVEEYQRKLYKHQLRQAKRELRLRKKRERQKERALRKQRRQLQRELSRLKERRSAQQEQLAVQDPAAAGGESAVQSGAPAGVDGARRSKTIEGARRQKRSFWSKLWLSLLGGQRSR